MLHICIHQRMDFPYVSPGSHQLVTLLGFYDLVENIENVGSGAQNRRVLPATSLVGIIHRRIIDFIFLGDLQGLCWVCARGLWVLGVFQGLLG